MSETSQHAPAGNTAAHRYSAADLAHFAGADRLSAGAAVAGEAGRRLRARLLADEMTAGHRVMMRLAARADYAMTNAANLGGRHALPFDLVAARFAGMAGRLMDQYRRGVASLPAIAGPDEEDEGEWIGFGFEGQPPLSPEEEERRIARAKAERAAHRGPRPQPPPLAPAEEEASTEADAVARRLAAEAQVDNLTVAENAPAREQLFLDEVSAGHRMMMRLAGRADFQIDRLGAPDAEPGPTQHAVLGLSSAAVRLMERVRLGLLALGRLQSGPGGGPRKVAGYYYTGPAGTYGFYNGDAPANDSPATDPAAPAAAGHGVDRTNLRRGRLKNGNPSGDYMAAPRCGAKTRVGGCCRQPAMASPRGCGGRCRLHGGKSTGPRTAAGLARSRRSRLSHGFRSAEVIELRKAAAATSRRLRTLLAGAPLAGHGLHRHDLRVVTGAGTEATSRPLAAATACTHLGSDAIHSPAPCGRGLGGGVCARQRAGESIVGARCLQLGDDCRDRLDDRVEFAHHLLVRETDDAIALRFQPARADRVLARRRLVRRAIDLDDQPKGKTHEIDDVAIEVDLTAKATIGNPLAAKLQPEPMFGTRLMVPQKLDVVVGHGVDPLLSAPRLYTERKAGVMRACRRETPPPNPRPQGAGEWTGSPGRCVHTVDAAGEGREGASVRQAATNVVSLPAGHGLHRHESHSTQTHRPNPLSRASGRGLV